MTTRLPLLVSAWNRDCASLGLVVVGVHLPEFEFGKLAENVDRSIREHGLTYPIAIDNEFAIWRTLDNDAWSAKYFLDRQGQLVRRWVGATPLRWEHRREVPRG